VIDPCLYIRRAGKGFDSKLDLKPDFDSFLGAEV